MFMPKKQSVTFHYNPVLCLNTSVKNLCRTELTNRGRSDLMFIESEQKNHWRMTLIETTFRAVMGRHSKINPSILGILIAAISGELKLFKPLCQTERSCLFFFCQQQWECLPKWNQTTGVYRNSWRDYLIFWLKPHFLVSWFICPGNGCTSSSPHLCDPWSDPALAVGAAQTEGHRQGPRHPAKTEHSLEYSDSIPCQLVRL